MNGKLDWLALPEVWIVLALMAASWIGLIWVSHPFEPASPHQREAVWDKIWNGNSNPNTRNNGL